MEGFTVRRGWLIILAFSVQLAVILTVTDPTALNIKKAVLLITLVIVLFGLLPNLRWWCFRIFAVGFVLNVLVISANGGLMPVTPENHQKVAGREAESLRLGQTPPHSKNVLLESSDTAVRFLSDTVYLSFPSPKIYSIGDLFLMAGLVVFLVEAPVAAVRSRLKTKTRDVTGTGALM